MPARYQDKIQGDIGMTIPDRQTQQPSQPRNCSLMVLTRAVKTWMKKKK